jgi:hypothetical protein
MAGLGIKNRNIPLFKPFSKNTLQHPRLKTLARNPTHYSAPFWKKSRLQYSICGAGTYLSASDEATGEVVFTKNTRTSSSNTKSHVFFYFSKNNISLYGPQNRFFQ